MSEPDDDDGLTRELRPSTLADVSRPAGKRPRLADDKTVKLPVGAAAGPPAADPGAEPSGAETPGTESPGSEGPGAESSDAGNAETARAERPAAEPSAAGDPPAEPGSEYEPGTPGGSPGRARRLSAGGAVIGLLLGLLGFGLVVQLRSNATDPGLANARPEDLVRILSDLDSRQERLREEINSLEATQRQLASGAQGRQAALDEARRHADELGILAGTLPATGPGLTITFVAGPSGVPAGTVLDTVEELRGAGAEAMQIGDGGEPVRIVASTYFADARDGLVVDGAHLGGGRYPLLVIGDPQTMQTALNIPGGVVDTVHQRGGNVIVQQSDAIRVTAVHASTAPKYARPVS